MPSSKCLVVVFLLSICLMMVSCSRDEQQPTYTPEQRSLNILLQTHGYNERITINEFQQLLESLRVTRNSTINQIPIFSPYWNRTALLQKMHCLNAKEIFDIYEMKLDQHLGKDMLQRMSPLLLLQMMVIPDCSKQINETVLKSWIEDFKGLNQEDNQYKLSIANPKVWICSSICVSIISLVGLAAVAIIPCLKNMYYNHLLQFLVALAVGSLTGDAMLHLFPHAIVNSFIIEMHLPNPPDESATVYKGLVALAGVYFFFNAEKILALITDFYAERKQIQEDMIRHEETGMEAAILRRASRVQVMDDDLIATGLSGKALRSMDNMKRYLEDDYEHALHVSNVESRKTSFAPNTNDLLHPNYKQHGHSDNLTVEPPEVKIILPDSDESQSRSVVEQVPSGHENAHGHSHGETIPDSVAGIAWMVIMGDGLHNFSDGLAIGAAFANGLAGGFSTSIAVFCHELPHELGDFAVLLKSGMKVKHALVFNVLSSFLCFTGMIIGIFVGNINHASYWIFAITGGMFIYISLVDMLPELNLVNVKPGESRIVHFVLQNAGIMTGVSIMLVIALYEDNIKNMLNEV